MGTLVYSQVELKSTNTQCYERQSFKAEFGLIRSTPEEGVGNAELNKIIHECENPQYIL